MTTQEQTFIDHIYAFARRLLLLRLLNRLIWLVLLILVLWLSVAVADRLFYFSTITRAGLWVIHVGILLYLLGRFLLSPLRDYWRLKQKSDLTQYVRILSKTFNDPHEDLVTAYQLITGRAQQGASGALQRAAIENILNRYDSSAFCEQAKIRPFLPPLSLTAAVVVGFGLFVSLHFTEFKRSTLRLLNPTKAYLPQPEYLLTVSPGDTTVVKGKDLRIIARYQGPSLAACRLVYWQPDRPQNPRMVLMKEKSQVFFYDLKNIRSDLMYAVEAEPRNRHLKDRIFRSSDFKVKMLIPPEVQEVQITVRPPAYTRMPKMVLEKNVGDFSAVAGSRVTVRIRSNKEVLSSAWVGFGSGTKVPFRLRGGSGTAEFFVRSADQYRIFLRDTSALGNPDPITYHIAVLPDDAPRVEIVQPGQDMESVPDAIIPVKMLAFDDFGVAGLKLFYRILSQGEMSGDTTWQSVSVPLPEINATRTEAGYRFDFNTLPIAFGDVVEYFARAYDNRPEKAQTGRTPVYRITFPTLDEMFTFFEQKQEEQGKRLKDVAEEAKKLQEKLKDLEREMRREKKVDWEKKQQMEKALQRQKEMNQKVEQIRKELEEAVKKIDENQLLAPEVLEKYRQLQELFQEVISPELMEAMQQLQKALQNPDPNNVRQALQRLKINQEAFEKSIERAMELLRQVQFEQKMDQLVQRAKELRRQQEKISQRLKEQENLSKEQRERTVKQQNAQREKLQRFNDQLEQFRQEERLVKFPQTKQQLDSLAAAMDRQQLAQQMRQVSEQVRQQRISQAQNQSQQVQQTLAQMEQALRRSQQMMQSSHKQEIKRKMAQILNRLLQLSRQQEALRNQTRRLSPTSDRFNRVAEQQEQVRRNLVKTMGDLVRLSKETFFISPRMNSLLNRAHRNMQQALDQLSERNAGGASRGETQAMGALNKGALQMRQSMSQLNQSQSGTGFEQFLQQLEQMAKAQGQINGQSMSLFQQQGNKGSYSVEQQAKMRRLAAQQAALRQALQQMDEQMGQRQDMLGRLGKTAEEMDKVVKDLLKNNLNRQTIQRQQRILSRLLDAQKSMKQKEYSKKRKAERPDQFVAKDPGKLGLIADARKKYLEEAMRRALQEGYGKDMRRLIEAYFNRLLQNSR